MIPSDGADGDEFSRVGEDEGFVDNAPEWAAVARNRDWLATLRPWGSEFLGLGGGGLGSAYSIPRVVEMEGRLSSNVKKYLSNYFVIVAAVSLIQVLTHPVPVLLLVGLGVVFRAAVGFVDERAFSVTVGTTRLGARHLGMVLTVCFISLALIFLGEPLFTFLGFSATTVFTHALLRRNNDDQRQQHHGAAMDSPAPKETEGAGGRTEVL